MYENRNRICRICGREFFGAFNAKYCPDCKVVTCPICGKRFTPTPARFTRYVKRGFLTCGDRECQAKVAAMRRRGWEPGRD